MKVIEKEKAYIIKASGDIQEVSPKNGSDFSLEELQEIVGGYIEVVYFHDGTNRIMIVDEEGKLKNYPINEAASEIAYQGKGVGIMDYIVGDVLLCNSKQVK